MTAIGLVVAVPAVLGYNVLLRRNKTVAGTGEPLHARVARLPDLRRQDGPGMDKPPPSAGIKPSAAAIRR